MRKWNWLISLLLIFISTAAIAGGKMVVLSIDDAIGPATQDYIQRGLATAASEHADIVLLELNTPGGLETSMRGINKAIIASPVPVITYVTPSSARAASAGTFIMYASHIAAMAPGTNIGAASPVNIGGNETSGNYKQLSVSEKKAVNDAVAYIRSLAELRGRNADWAESAVRNAASISAEVAKKHHVIDIVANNNQQLLDQIHGKKVRVQNATETLNTKHLTIENILPDWRSRFLSFITNPNIAYLLMLMAIYGLFFEFANPGMVLPGVAGLIALVLALYAFQLMPINYVGLTLLFIGIIFIIFEIFVASFGVIGVGGLIAFIIGSIMLFDIHDANYQLARTLIVLMSIITITFFFILLNLTIRSQKKAIVTGKEALIGSEGTVLSIMNEQVIVRVLGEIWEARCDDANLQEGDKVIVTQADGLKLVVERRRIV